MIFCNYCKEEKEESFFAEKPDGTKYKACKTCRDKYCANRKPRILKPKEEPKPIEVKIEDKKSEDLPKVEIDIDKIEDKPKIETKDDKILIKRAYPKMPKHPILEKEDDSPIKTIKGSEDSGLLMYGLTFMFGLFVGRNMK